MNAFKEGPKNLFSTFLSSAAAILIFTVVRNIRLEHLIHFPTFVIITLFLVLYVIHEFYWKRRYLPPGPIPWLVAGNFPQVLFNGPDLDRTFLKWKQRYGGIFTFWMGPIPMVMVSDIELLKRYFIRNGDSFSGRWQNFITHAFLDGHNGVVQTEGDKWREQRRFSLHVLRDFGLGRASMEEKIQEEVDALIHHLDEEVGDKGDKLMQVTKPIAVCVANIINNILFGKTYKHDDASFMALLQMLDRQSALVIQPLMGLYLCAPFTVHLPLLNCAWTQFMDIRDRFWAFLEKQLVEHKRGFDPVVQPTDFTYAYMAEMLRRRETSDMTMGHFSDKQLKMLLLDLFFAGSETTVTTIKWGILMFVLHPDVQNKCYQEVAEKLGGKRIELKDRVHLTYLQATICEIQRVANILSFNLLRTCTESIEIDGFRFPAGTMVLPQVSIAMNDPENFAEPERFWPERFIDENANLRKYEAFLPFSIGKRQCLGESLARAELFLIFTNLIRNFEFCAEFPNDPKNLPSRRRVYGITVSPQPFRCKVLRRRVMRTGGDRRRTGNLEDQTEPS